MLKAPIMGVRALFAKITGAEAPEREERKFRESYRPEVHYMRGPGPACAFVAREAQRRNRVANDDDMAQAAD